MSPLSLRPMQSQAASMASSHTDGMSGIGDSRFARLHQPSPVRTDGGLWLESHALAGSSAFWAQLIGQMMPPENRLQPAVIRQMHASYAQPVTPYGSESLIFFSPYALDKDRYIDLYS
ncbi:hypothetical protein [Thalassospira sp.]|uniref:hypothetical protein n=1 Tax=Thalassospira sp. TaxID=1912094 RepID=UPI0027342601|nr:hypothetical protein [Thalassospira sp.]MDP2697238.1 hypothetical protein [Thalassospira sp.]